MLFILINEAVADPGFPRGGGANSPGGRQHTILPNFPKNCMKLKEFGPRGGRGRASKILLCRSATVKHKSCQSCRVGIHKELDRAVTSIKQFTFNVRQMLAPQITDQKATFYWIVSLYHSYLYWLLPKGPIRTIIFVA